MGTTLADTRVSPSRDIRLVVGVREERLLQTYDFSELLDMNDLTEEDVVELLIDQDLIDFIKPCDL